MTLTGLGGERMEDKQLGIINTSFGLVCKFQEVKTFVSDIYNQCFDDYFQ